MKPRIIESRPHAPNRRYAKLLPERKDVGLVLEGPNKPGEFNEFDILLVVLDHLRAKRQRSVFPSTRHRINDRIAEVALFQQETSEGPPDTTRSFELTPQEAESAAQRLSASVPKNYSVLWDPAAEFRLRAADYISHTLGLGWHEICIGALQEQQSPRLPVAA